MNKLTTAIQNKKEKLLNIYITAGYPKLDSLPDILESLWEEGVDMVEIGIPFSDPLADGETIQQCNATALRNGITIETIFNQIEKSRDTLPKLMMSYFNPVYRFGVERFCQKCKDANVSGVIIPDLPMEIWRERYQSLFEKYNLSTVFLIGPATSKSRILEIDKVSSPFIYAVSSASTTGNSSGFQSKSSYLENLNSLPLKNPVFVGFNIRTAKDLEKVHQKAAGAIIGSAFMKALDNGADPGAGARKFIQSLKINL